MIADKARLKVAPWDGYLKYYNLGEKVGGRGRPGTPCPAPRLLVALPWGRLLHMTASASSPGKVDAAQTPAPPLRFPTLLLS